MRQTKNRRIKQDVADMQVPDPWVRGELPALSHPVRATRYVSLETASTSGGRGRRKQAHQGRKTWLEIRAVSICVKRPYLTRADEKELHSNVVVVRDVDPPAGQALIEWRLITIEPIATAADVLRVVHAYRARWLIEEFCRRPHLGVGGRVMIKIPRPAPFNKPRPPLDMLRGIPVQWVSVLHLAS